MLKFFQKYQKLILGVGGSLLMVIFLLPAGMSQMMGGSQGDRVVGHIGKVEIASGMLDTAGRELEVIEQIQRSVYFQSQANHGALRVHARRGFHP